MKHSIKKGLSFGITSGIITTLGVIVGLGSGTSSRSIVLSGILVIALTDSLSDSMGIHISEEAEQIHTEKEIWISTASTFFTKLIVALSFLVPTLLLPIRTAIVVSIVWGLSLIVILSFYLAKKQGSKVFFSVTEHLTIAIFVIVATNYIGIWASSL